jgi:hypothetical protein
MKKTGYRIQKKLARWRRLDQRIPKYLAMELAIKMTY